MSFLAPLAWIGALLALPLIALYLVRDEPRRRVVSNFLLWASHPLRAHESARWRRLRRLFSLIVQLLFLVFVLAALARPIFPWGERGGQPAVFVLDASLSMAATDVSPSRSADAAARLRDFIGGLGVDDEAAILTTTPEILSGWTRNKRELMASIERYAPGPVARSPVSALELAKTLGEGRSARLLFLTDGVWDGPRDPLEFPEITFVKIGTTAENAGISHLAARRSVVAPGAVSLATSVSRSALGSPAGLDFSLTRDGALIDAREVTLSAGETWSVDWEFQIEEGATFTAAVSGLPGDRLAADDSFSLRIDPLREVDVMLVSPPDRFIEAALDAIPGVNITRIWPADSVRYGDATKLWIFKGAVPSPDFQFAGLLLLAPEQSGFFGEWRGEMSDPVITEWIGQDSATRFTALDRIVLERAVEIVPRASADVFASSAGRPLIFGDLEAPSKWLVVAIDTDRSDLVLRAAFPVLLANVVGLMREEPPLVAVGPSPAVSALKSNLDNEAEVPALLASLRPSRPLWWWLLFAAVVWVFAEWWSYHRRITE